MAKVVEVELIAKTDKAVDGVNKVEKAVEKTARAAKKTSKELSGLQQAGNEVVKGLDRLTGGLASKFVAVGKAAKLSGKAMRTALISSGIGLAVAAVGLLVEYWDEIGEALGFINKDLERQIELNNKNLDAVGVRLRNIKTLIELRKREGKDVDLLLKKEKQLTEQKKQALITSIQDQALLVNRLKLKQKEGKLNEEDTKELEKQEGVYLDLINNFNKFKSDLLEPVKEVVKKDTSASEAEKLAEQQRLKAIDDKAASIEEITKLEDDFLQSQLDKQTQEENAVRDKYFTLIEEAKKYKLDTTVLEEARQKELQVISDTYTEKEKERAAKILESENEISISKKRFAAEEIQDEVLRLEKLKEIDLLEAEQEAARLQVIVDNAKDGSDAKMDAEIALNEFLEEARQKNLTNEKKVSDASVKISELEADAKQTALDGYAGAVSSLSNTIGQETAAGKGLAVASSLISTYAAITATLENAAKTPAGGIPGYAIAQSVATGIAGLAAVKKIVSVKVPGGGGGSSQTGSMPTAPQPPAFNIVGASGETQLADAIGGQTQRPARAYVVSNDVTTAQELDRNIIEGASI